MNLEAVGGGIEVEDPGYSRGFEYVIEAEVTPEVQVVWKYRGRTEEGTSV